MVFIYIIIVSSLCVILLGFIEYRRTQKPLLWNLKKICSIDTVRVEKQIRYINVYILQAKKYSIKILKKQMYVLQYILKSILEKIKLYY